MLDEKLAVLGTLIVPDLILPAQINQRPNATPLQKIAYAMMKQVLEDLCAACQSQRTDRVVTLRTRRRIEARYAEAMRWVEGEDAPFSFDFCCEVVGVNPSVYRAGIKRACQEWRAGIRKGVGLERSMIVHSPAKIRPHKARRIGI